jgi:CheY-like chemotaxis protein
MNSAQRQILIVEDDQYIRESIHELLEMENYSVLSAGNGQEALDLLRSAQSLPSLILLDLMMPVKDGFAFCVEQHEDPNLKNIPVVILSADGRAFSRQAETHARAFLRKPVDLDEILNLVKSLIV